MRRIEKIIFNTILMVCPVLSACTETLSPTVAPLTSKALTPPPLLYIANNQLYQKQPASATRMIASLGEKGDVMDAVRVKDSVFVLRGMGLQRIDMKTGKTKMAVEFDKIPLWGNLDRTSNENVLLYSTAWDSACSSTGIGATIGLYQVNKDTFRDVFAKDEGYLRPLGLTTDQQSIYGLPLGCDPEFDRFWLISIDQGKVTKELPTWDATSKEYGEAYAALSPDAHFLAFRTSRHVEDSLKYGLSIYDLDNLTIKHYELPNPPSHTGELLWSPTSQKLYFVLNAGMPYDESSESYGLWSLDIHTAIFLPIAGLDDRFLHLVTISPDGQWILLQPEVEQSVTYVYLPTGEKVVIHLPPEGVSQIVR